MNSSLRVAIIWHMHQPDYRDPGTSTMAFPWVRLHALKDYLDMPLRAEAFSNVRCTFNLVPSLIDQLSCYQQGWDDPHLQLCRLDPELVELDVRAEILEGMFPGHPPTMFRPHQRYHELFQKYEETRQLGGRAAQHFTSQELRDLQVWSNLVWIDPIFQNESPVRELMARARYFTEAEKVSLLEWQHRRLQDVIPTYQRLVREKRIEVSFTPYYHPILPLLCDSRAALDALPELTLPQNRFMHSRDAEIQILRSRELYQSLFNRELTGMWPSEGSISEEVLALFSNQQIRWAATDEEVLAASYRRAGMNYHDVAKFRVHDHNGVKLLFRDHQLSDRIGFVYSGWEGGKAADDFMGHLRDIARFLGDRCAESVVPIILDGENAWEYYANDGHEFLTEWYSRLHDAHSRGEFALVTADEAVSVLPSISLPRIQAGSWINHNFRIWIGHHEDNLAWDLLWQTRADLELAISARPDLSPDIVARCWEQIYRAEGSDWFWWFGDEHVGPDNPKFDDLYRRHLRAVYNLLGLAVPDRLFLPISGKQIAPTIRLTSPYGFLTPQIDGRFSTFYEWSGAGEFELAGSGGAMHRVDSRFHRLRYAFDENNLYLLVEWRGKPVWSSGMRLILHLNNEPLIGYQFTGNAWKPETEKALVTASIEEIAEWGISRSLLTSTDSIALQFELRAEGGLLEHWPSGEPIRLPLSHLDQAIEWPL